MVTGTFGILAKKGRGKTYTAAVLAEGMLAAGVPVCVLDPTGVWWGLRSSADGTAAGLPVVIFGGERADVPLHETAGAVIAQILAAQPFPAVIDLSGLSKSAMRRFAADFLEALYLHNRQPLHLIIDEADLFAPQRAFAGVERLLGAAEDVVRRGRVRGLGVTLITQRPAALNKGVLTQVDGLLVLGMTGLPDVAAIDEWVRQHAEDADAKAVKESLPSLPVGECWLWWPEWLDRVQRIRVRTRTTFDSSATPRPGRSRIQPQRWATVDVGALGSRIAELVDQAAETDPAHLRRRIATLEQQLAASTSAPSVIEVPVAVLTDEHVASLLAAVDQLRADAAALTAAADTISAALSVRNPITAPLPPTPAALGAAARPLPTGEPPAIGEVLGRRDDRPTVPTGLGKAEREILTTLVRHGRCTTARVALLTRRSAKSGGYRNALSSLRSAGLITGRGEIEATPEGRQRLGDSVEPLPEGLELISWWNEQLGKAERLVLAEIIDSWPEPLTPAALAERTGYAATSGGFRNALSRLRSLGLAYGHGDLTVNDTLGAVGSRRRQPTR